MSRARKQTVKSVLQAASDQLAHSSKSFILDDAIGLINHSYLASRFKAVAKLLYSTIGAKVTNSEAIIPAPLWEAAQFYETSTSSITLSNTVRQIADSAVMDYFTVDVNAIDKLNATAILELKAEPITARYINELDEAVEEASIQSSAGNADLSEFSRLAEDRAKSIRKAVIAKCRSEEKHLKVESWVFGGTEEAGGIVANLAGVGLVKRGLASLARRLARKSKKLSWLDYTSAPLATYVSRYRTFVARRRPDLNLGLGN